MSPQIVNLAEDAAKPLTMADIGSLRSIAGQMQSMAHRMTAKQNSLLLQDPDWVVIFLAPLIMAFLVVSMTCRPRLRSWSIDE